MRIISTLLATLITFTSPNKWRIISGKGEALKPGMNQLCNNIMGHLNARGLYPALQTLLYNGLARSKPAFRPASFTAILTLALRPLMAADLSDNLLTLFLLHILSVPALVHHMNIMSQECLIQMMTHRIFSRSIELLCHEQSTRIVFNSLEGNYSLCLLANLIQLGNAEMEGLVESTNSFMFVVTRLLECCKIYVQSKKSSLSHWHPVLGWFQQRTDPGLYETLPLVEQQLQMLWNVKMLHILFEQLFAYNDLQAVVEVKHQTATSKNIFKKALEKAAAHKTTCKVRLDSPVLVSTCLACGMYLTAIQTLTQLKLSILSGLTCQDVLLPRLWKLITDLGPQCGLKAFMDVISAHNNDTSHVIFHLLHLGCATATHIITILDDIELYEQSKPFNQLQLQAISCFLNHFIFRAIWSGEIGKPLSAFATNDAVFQAVHQFLMLLYQRDCRRSFTPPNHWLIKDIRISVFMGELERGRKSAATFLLQKVPHIIPHKERVMLFRKNITKEKEVLGVTESVCASPHSTLITVHRPRLIEDGYRQLSMLPGNALKGIIRVKFINEQGLDEAGIDQDGVFKEFLEETIMRVFDPSLNLFKVTSEQKLYPSSTSSIQENHLALFEFVGRMLGKAVYEGIVVDVPFAPFFLSQIMGHQHGATYSSMDELPSLDPELYRSLTYVKHYEGDISDLEFTFSYDEDILGKVVTHELVPGGRVIPVTNENKINYVHLMAHFKMHSQIKDQTSAFIKGFRAIINPDWLAMFSTNELQKLISGDNADVDLDDLRKHTQYYGGFHNNHRVVSWLWDILDKDFNPKERSLFLKFVTSCSKPPLLGFANLEPPFSIRCVEVSDDQDTGDTVGSVLKGFFNIRKRDPVSRLPTSSTCFNLLKLPNYQKKSTLREKLRYAITSNTGFELS
ncbi:hypothetical protein CAPTEDRAFT_162148 [Capitella teleta]|uniref:Ubiquitin-protein ligase E3B n=1 Tax=Capitella teleta TaxID=283909 RepID=R7TQ24_CAPTE|nr:hypothetical protein CAPTEDRAFT_162148 [Capitella teleta]|eukprot:ELT93611.1 hypothetical protein CAPTEDRAFT_162148 [Capitella teleta]